MKTKNYSMFSYSANNREVKASHVEKIKQSMQLYGFVEGKPILCTKSGIIIDGQHRYEAAKILGIEIVYEYIYGDVDKQMVELNSTQNNWTLSDYINSYANQNIDCYRKLLKFQDKYKLGMSNSISVFMIKSNSVSSQIRSGKVFNINPYAEQIAEYVSNCAHVPYHKEHKFIQAINVVYKKLNRAQLQKIKDNLMSIPQFSKSSDYIIAFENILNKGKRGENRVKLV